VISVVMVAASVAVGYVMKLAYASATPEQYFPLFLGLFMVLFAASGIGNGSTFRMIPVIFRAERLRAAERTAAAQQQAAHEGNRDGAAALGFASSIGAYGGFFIPKSLGTSIALTGGPAAALVVFVLFYLSCVALTWWNYSRRYAPMPC